MIRPDEYIITTDNTNYPLDIYEVNCHLKTDFTSLDSDFALRVYLKAVEKFAENITRRTLLNKTFTNYRTYFCYVHNTLGFELRRCKLQSVNSVKYIDAYESEQTIDSVYYDVTVSNDFSNLYFTDDFEIPVLSQQNPQPIIIEFVAGYGDTYASIPQDLRHAMLAHLAQVYQNRGDCPTSTTGMDNFFKAMLPKESYMVYMQNRIEDLVI